MERLQDAHTHLNSSLHLTLRNRGIVALASIAIDAADDNQKKVEGAGGGP
ncbi:hypothetical protein IVA80_00850 [Bradyrhizobium sp. 139]|nr:hypothetical protein [Bradyrhizobium sp. 139]MCK1739458.1 hypothetical protein [Bradyrhizobium sp. 139]